MIYVLDPGAQTTLSLRAHVYGRGASVLESEVSDNGVRWWNRRLDHQPTRSADAITDLLHGQYERGADTGFSRLQELRKTGLHSMRMAPLQLPVLSPWAK